MIKNTLIGLLVVVALVEGYLFAEKSAEAHNNIQIAARAALDGQMCEDKLAQAGAWLNKYDATSTISASLK